MSKKTPITAFVMEQPRIELYDDGIAFVCTGDQATNWRGQPTIIDKRTKAMKVPDDH